MTRQLRARVHPAYPTHGRKEKRQPRKRQALPSLKLWTRRQCRKQAITSIGNAIVTLLCSGYEREDSYERSFRLRGGCWNSAARRIRRRMVTRRATRSASAVPPKRRAPASGLRGRATTAPARRRPGHRRRRPPDSGPRTVAASCRCPRLRSRRRIALAAQDSEVGGNAVRPRRMDGDEAPGRPVGRGNGDRRRSSAEEALHVRQLARLRQRREARQKQLAVAA